MRLLLTALTLVGFLAACGGEASEEAQSTSALSACLAEHGVTATDDWESPIVSPIVEECRKAGAQ